MHRNGTLERADRPDLRPALDATSGALFASLAAATDSLRSLPEVVHRLPTEQLGRLLRAVDDLAALAEAGRVTITAAAVRRGAVGGSRAGSATAWVKAHAPSQAAQGAATTGRVATLLAAPDAVGAGEGAGAGSETGADAGDGVGMGAVPWSATAVIGAAVASGRIQPGVALTVAAEFDRLRRRLTEEAVRVVLDALVEMGHREGSRGVVKVLPELLRRYGRPGELQALHDAATDRATLSRPRPDGLGGHTYSFTTDPETMAALEARLLPMTRPVPGPDGEPDRRTSEQRRGQAFTRLLHALPASMSRRPTSSAAGGEASAPGFGCEPVQAEAGPGSGPPSAHASATSSAYGSGWPSSPRSAMWPPAPSATAPPGPGSAPATSSGDAVPLPASAKAVLYVTVSYDDLRNRFGAGTVIGGFAAGTLIPPDTLRRLACDAGILPVVLGARGEILDLGRRERWFQPGQSRALWLRDDGCTFPGCDAPAHLADAHHIRHWADGGATDLANAALLCRHHHREVHRDDLWATVHSPDEYGRCVTWDTTPGSYARALARLRPAGGARR